MDGNLSVFHVIVMYFISIYCQMLILFPFVVKCEILKVLQYGKETDIHSGKALKEACSCTGDNFLNPFFSAKKLSCSLNSFASLNLPD